MKYFPRCNEADKMRWADDFLQASHSSHIRQPITGQIFTEGGNTNGMIRLEVNLKASDSTSCHGKEKVEHPIYCCEGYIIRKIERKKKHYTAIFSPVL